MKKIMKDLESIKLKDLECKHTALPLKDKIFINLAKNVDYPWAVLGSQRNGSIDYEKQRISIMELEAIERPIRIVRDRIGRLWADNTNWTIAYMKKYGQEATLKNVPFYFVDFYNTESKNGKLYKGDIPIESQMDISNILTAAKDIQNRLDKNWRNKEYSFTVMDLFQELYPVDKTLEQLYQTVQEGQNIYILDYNDITLAKCSGIEDGYVEFIKVDESNSISEVLKFTYDAFGSEWFVDEHEAVGKALQNMADFNKKLIIK